MCTINPTGGHPVVYGDWLGAAGAADVLVYGHYDVQPPDPLEQWNSPPFEPTVRDGRLYARGVSDDKGPMLIPIKVAEAFFATAGRLPVNVKFMFEGEEEIGSRHLDAFVAAHAEELAADVVLSADGAMWRPTSPRSRWRAAASRPWSSRSSARSRTCIPAAMAAASPTRCMPWRGSRLAA